VLSAADALGLASDFIQVVRALPRIESGRRRAGPGVLVALARAQGRSQTAREQHARRRLRRVIRLVDRLLLDGGNCFRRALLEMAVDAGAAREQLTLGLRAHGGPQSGHAWLGGAETNSASYDAVFAM
jgi:hypothetical protein